MTTFFWFLVLLASPIAALYLIRAILREWRRLDEQARAATELTHTSRSDTRPGADEPYNWAAVELNEIVNGKGEPS